MSSLRFCPMCCQNVTTEPSFNLPALIMLTCFFIIPGVIYYILRRHERCPICHTANEYLRPFRSISDDF